MQNTLFRKGLVVGIIILLAGVSVLSSVSSKDASFINDKVIDDNNEIEPFDYEIKYDSSIESLPNDLKYKDYKNCRIYCDNDPGVTGKAYLFPGYFKTVWHKGDIPVWAEVNGSCGILKGKYTYVTDGLRIDEDVYLNWEFAIVYGFYGKFTNDAIEIPGYSPIFIIDGYVTWCRLYYDW
jgi:hypothetical protein